jgi:hypothetical protein
MGPGSAARRRAKRREEKKEERSEDRDEERKTAVVPSYLKLSQDRECMDSNSGIRRECA